MTYQTLNDVIKRLAENSRVPAEQMQQLAGRLLRLRRPPRTGARLSDEETAHRLRRSGQDAGDLDNNELNELNEFMKITRQWAMPNSNTFDVEPIRQLITKYARGVIVDPFANQNKIATITNDLNPAYDTTYHMDATDFLKMLDDASADTMLYDPPYSPRQVAECYKEFGQTVNMETTQAAYWSDQKREISRIVKPNGICITCSWNSGGIGQKYGFEIVEILMVAHGGWHNDTIVVVERKVPTLFDL